MCPLCLTAAAFLAAGTGMAAGFTGLTLGKRRSVPHNPAPAPHPASQEI